MSELSSIQKGITATRQVKGVHFDWDFPEVTYTSPSQGGAASLLNDAYLFKAAKAVESDLDESQASILAKIGEEFTTLQKSVDGNNPTPSSVSTDGDTGESKILNKESKIMTDVTREEFEELQKALAVSQAVNSIAGYAFEADLNKAVASAVATLSAEDAVSMNKAFDALVARGEVALDKAVLAAKAPVEEENPLAKSLAEESGEEGEADEPVEKSLAQRAIEAQNKAQGDK